MLASHQSALSAQEPFKVYLKPFFFARFGYLSRSFLLHNQQNTHTLPFGHLTPILLAVGDTVVLSLTATIHNFSSDVVNTSMATFKHWYHHRQLELVFYTEAPASPGACPTSEHFEAAVLHHRTEDSTSLETLLRTLGSQNNSLASARL